MINKIKRFVAGVMPKPPPVDYNDESIIRAMVIKEGGGRSGWLSLLGILILFSAFLELAVVFVAYPSFVWQCTILREQAWWVSHYSSFPHSLKFNAQYVIMSILPMGGILNGVVLCALLMYSGSKKMTVSSIHNQSCTPMRTPRRD